MAPEPLVRLKGLSKRFGQQVALAGLDLELRGGELLGLVGPSGAGKTTLLRILAGLEPPGGGRLELFGRQVHGGTGPQALLAHRRQTAMVQQRPVVFARSVDENVALGLRFRGLPPAEVDRKVQGLLELVGLEVRRGCYAPRLSGGEAQRVAFARTLAVDPRLLLLDEFTANLDPHNVQVLEAALLRYLETHPESAAIVVSHNLPQARRLTRELAVLIQGRLVERGPTRRLFERPERAPTAAYLSGEMVC